QSPERGAREIFERMKSGGKLYVSTGNIAFWPLRIMLLLGQFNYGRRGILDLTHTRLFTLGTFKRLLRNAGFRIDEVRGFGPLVDLAGKGRPSRLSAAVDGLFAGLARYWPRLFAYQLLLVCTRTDSPSDLMKQTFREDIGQEVTGERTSIYGLIDAK